MKNLLNVAIILVTLVIPFLSCSSSENPSETGNTSTITINDVIYDVPVATSVEISQYLGEPIKAVRYNMIATQRDDSSRKISGTIVQVLEGDYAGKSIVLLSHVQDGLYSPLCDKNQEDETIVLESLQRNGSGMILNTEVTLCRSHIVDGSHSLTQASVKFNIHT